MKSIIALVLCLFVAFNDARKTFKVDNELRMRQDVVSPGSITFLAGLTDVTSSFMSGSPVPVGTVIVLNSPMVSDDGLNTTYGFTRGSCIVTTSVQPQAGFCTYVFDVSVPDFGTGTIVGACSYKGTPDFIPGTRGECTAIGTGDFADRSEFRSYLNPVSTRDVPLFSDTPFGPSYHLWTFLFSKSR